MCENCNLSIFSDQLIPCCLNGIIVSEHRTQERISISGMNHATKICKYLFGQCIKLFIIGNINLPIHIVLSNFILKMDKVLA